MGATERSTIYSEGDVRNGTLASFQKVVGRNGTLAFVQEVAGRNGALAFFLSSMGGTERPKCFRRVMGGTERTQLSFLGRVVAVMMLRVVE